MKPCYLGNICIPDKKLLNTVGCEAVKKATLRNRFLFLKKWCHIADNCNLSASKVAKKYNLCMVT